MGRHGGRRKTDDTADLYDGENYLALNNGEIDIYDVDYILQAQSFVWWKRCLPICLQNIGQVETGRIS